MKLLDTSSKYCKIAVEDDKKYLIRYPRKIGITQEYYRSTPEYEVLRDLQNSGIKVPKLIGNDNNCTVLEYIEGDSLNNIYSNNTPIGKNIINQVVEQICAMTEVDGKNLLKYAKWNNNKTFFSFQCENTENVFLNYYEKLHKLYNELGISEDVMKFLYEKSSQIDVKRKMSIIHGDRHKNNTILDGNNIVFIDWELACIGDVAYDIAFHLHHMGYSEEEEKYFISLLKMKYKGDSKKLLKDVELYRTFMLLRSVLYLVRYTLNEGYTNAINEEEKEEKLTYFMNRYNRLSKLNGINFKQKSKEELDKIFSDYKEEITVTL